MHRPRRRHRLQVDVEAGHLRPVARLHREERDEAVSSGQEPAEREVPVLRGSLGVVQLEPHVRGACAPRGQPPAALRPLPHLSHLRLALLNCCWVKFACAQLMKLCGAFVTPPPSKILEAGRTCYSPHTHTKMISTCIKYVTAHSKSGFLANHNAASLSHKVARELTTPARAKRPMRQQRQQGTKELGQIRTGIVDNCARTVFWFV